MFPEPDNTGSGNPTTDTTSEEPIKATEVNPFDASFSDEEPPADTQQQPSEEETDTEEFKLTFDDGLDLDDSEKSLFSEAAQEAGLSAEVASKVFSGLVRKVNANNERIIKERQDQALAELRKNWGKNFDANARQAAQFIKTVGARRGWTPEQMSAFKNPHDMALFYDIAQATTGRLSLGTNSAAPKAPRTKEQLSADLNSTIAEYWGAKSRNDTKEMKRLSDLHMEIIEAQTGKKGVRLLAIG